MQMRTSDTEVEPCKDAVMSTDARSACGEHQPERRIFALDAKRLPWIDNRPSTSSLSRLQTLQIGGYKCSARLCMTFPLRELPHRRGAHLGPQASPTARTASKGGVDLEQADGMSPRRERKRRVPRACCLTETRRTPVHAPQSGRSGRPV